MFILQSIALYFAIGVGIAAAFILREHGNHPRKWLLGFASVFFWPLLVPILLMPSGSGVAPARPEWEPSSRVRAAMAGLDGAAQELAVPEIARVRAHASAVAALEGRLSEMDAMLRTPEFDRASAERTLEDLLRRGLVETDARVASVRGRVRNIDRLRGLRQQCGENLERVSLQMEEITAQLKLLRFAGRSTADNEAVAAIRQVADSMQAMTEAMLREDHDVPASA